LVGFKYIAQTIDAEGPDRFVFGMEESLGYLAGDYCRDKDAAIAALYAMELAAELRKRGKTLLDRLDELYVEHGYFVEAQKSVVCKGAQGQEQIQQLMARLRQSPPIQLAGQAFSRVRDYGRHEVRSLPKNVKTADISKPEGELLIFESGDSSGFLAFAARPSGTEPKIKFYLFGGSRCGDSGALAEAKDTTDAAVRELSAALSTWIDQTLETA
jgi:phosphoglucomutase/phosphomannomutase